MDKRLVCARICSHLEKSKDDSIRQLQSLKQSLLSESKSSAGDKHETARAMIHQEMRQVNDTLVRAERALHEVNQIGESKVSPVRVASGVLVETDGPWVLVGVALNRIDMREGHVYGVSSEAPLAKAWHGAEVGDVKSLGPNQLTIVALH